MKSAIVLGATGLVGNELVDLLVNDSRYESVVLLVRRKTGLSHPKIMEELINFDKPEEWMQKIKGDVLFSAFGTTIKKAGTKENQYKIDFTYQFEIAKAAAANDVKTYVLILSAGANINSNVFYTRMKGELDEAVKKLPFEKCIILKPSILEGKRKEVRMGERIGLVLAKVFTQLPIISRYKPIPARLVAKAMIKADTLSNLKPVYELTELFALAKQDE